MTTYKVCWHDTGCVVFCSDGSRLPFKGKRYSASELAGMTKAAISRLPGAIWSRFSAK